MGYREEVLHQRRRIVWLVAPMLVGAAIGTALLLITSNAASSWSSQSRRRLLPAAPPPAAALAPADATGARSPLFVAGLTGRLRRYFDAVGIMLIALLTLVVDQTVQRLNAVKIVLAGLANLLAACVYAFLAPVNWPFAVTLMVSSLIGGQLGAIGARRIRRHPARGDRDRGPLVADCSASSSTASAPPRQTSTIRRRAAAPWRVGSTGNACGAPRTSCRSTSSGRRAGGRSARRWESESRRSSVPVKTVSGGRPREDAVYRADQGSSSSSDPAYIRPASRRPGPSQHLVLRGDRLLAPVGHRRVEERWDQHHQRGLRQGPGRASRTTRRPPGRRRRSRRPRSWARRRRPRRLRSPARPSGERPPQRSSREPADKSAPRFAPAPPARIGRSGTNASSRSR